MSPSQNQRARRTCAESMNDYIRINFLQWFLTESSRKSRPWDNLLKMSSAPGTISFSG